MQECQKQIGLNYSLLMEQRFDDYQLQWEIKNSDAAAKAAFSLTEVLFKLQRYELHEKACHFFLDDLKLLPQSIYTAEIYRQLAHNYDLNVNHLLAEKTYNEAFDFLNSITAADEKLKWRICASLWYNRSSPSRSAESREKLTAYTRQSIKFFEYLHDIEGMSLCLNRLALLLPDEDYTEKFKLLNKVLSINNGPKANPKNIASAKFNIGYYSFLSGDEELGLAYMNEALDNIFQHTNIRYYGLALLQMAKAFFKREKFLQAKGTCLNALSIFKSIEVKAHIQEAEALIQQIDSAL